MTDVVNPCDVCGRPTVAADCAEIIEEWLCEECASGISEDEQDDDWDGCCEECGEPCDDDSLLCRECQRDDEEHDDYDCDEDS